MDDFVQCWSNPHIKYFKIWHWNTSCWWRRFKIIHWPLIQSSPLLLIHSMASVGNCEQVHTSVLNLSFQQANVAGFWNLSLWRSKICCLCWSAPQFFENNPSLGSNEFLADSPDWHFGSKAVWCLAFARYMRHCGSAFHPPRITTRWERHKLTGNVGMSIAPWFRILKISRIIMTINFLCSSWVLAVSSWIVSWCSINLLLENSTDLDPLKSLQFFHLIMTFTILLWLLFLK